MHTLVPLRHARLLPALAAALLAAACSSSNSSGTAGTGGTSSTTTTTATGTTTTGPGGSGATGGTGGSACPGGPGYTGSGQMLAVGSASATVVDPTGAPIPGLEIQLCGINICDSAMTDANGTVNVPGSSTTKLTQPVFKFGDGLTYAKLGIPILSASPAPSFPNLVDTALPATGTAFTTGGNAVSGGVTLAIPAADVVSVDMLNYETADSQLFRAVQIPVSKEMPVIMPSGLAIGILVGVAPLETTFCPAVGVTVPNTAGWPASTAVEFYLHGVDTFQEWSVYGGWTKVSDGTVSADGTSVSTTAGAGFPVLETFAVVEKQ